LNYDAGSFQLTGTPTANGLFSVGMAVTDSAGRTGLQTLTIRVGNANVITSSYNLITGAVNHLTISAHGNRCVASGMVSARFGTIALGCSSTSGLISGTPTVRARNRCRDPRYSDATGQLAFKAFNIQIQVL
jgi:hypothetical protein